MPLLCDERVHASFTPPFSTHTVVGRVQAGRRTSLSSKSVVLVLPGNGYTPESLDSFSAAAAAADASLLEIAWAVAAEEPAGTSYSLSQLCQLLFDTQTPLDQYATFSMLLADKVYFKTSYKVRRKASLCQRATPCRVCNPSVQPHLISIGAECAGMGTCSVHTK